MAAAHLKR